MKLKIIIKNIFYSIRSLLYKKDESIVVCGAWFGEKFADNPRFLFQYLSDNKRKLGLSHVVWVSYDPKLCKELTNIGYEAYLMNSKESVYYHKHAKYQICNNSPLTHERFRGELLEGYSFRSVRINLWHGTGIFKNFNMASNEYKNKVKKHKRLYTIKNMLYRNSSIFRKFISDVGGWGDCYFLTTSKYELKKFQKCYPLPETNFIVSGYPRTSYLSKLLESEEEIITKIEEYEKVILYLPTFRGNASDFDMNTLSSYFNRILKERNILFIQKAHSAYDGKKGFSFDENVLNLDVNFDINVLIRFVDIVITDYSSILADAIYYRKPIVLYTPDYDDYVNGERGFLTEAEEILSVAVRFDKPEAILNFISNNYDNFEVAKQKSYNEIRRKIWGDKEKNIKEIWKDIMEQTI